ncbi:MAG: hypothetical protein EXX96DRAFT_513918 [Benjaminiella poitrasii]|nr:MAG: hypothetical protein EXX96DRAFT_513918 [Benjaminiella poitrasii]
MSSSAYFTQSSQPDGPELAAKLVSLFSITLLSALFGIKTYNVHFKYLTYSRWLILGLYLFSWSFTTISMILVTTNNRNYTSCFLSIMVCDIFYSGTKITIYAWLIEKVYVVSSIRQTRWKSKAYRFHICLLLPYIAIFTLMLVFHTSEIEDTGICIIGLQSIASLPLLIYDFLINFYMTVFFVRPLAKLSAGAKPTSWRTSRLNEVALRTLVASVVCLIASFANVLALILLHGRQRGLVCLTCCTVDVTINVITIHWVTSQTPGKRRKETGVDYSTHHQRESTPENSAYQRQQDPDSTLHYNHSGIDVDMIVAQQTNISAGGATNFYGFTNSDYQIEDFKSVPPYSPNVTNNNNPNLANIKEDMVNKDRRKCEDQISTDSNFFGSSIHESQSSRKSLTKR